MSEPRIPGKYEFVQIVEYTPDYIVVRFPPHCGQSLPPLNSDGPVLPAYPRLRRFLGSVASPLGAGELVQRLTGSETPAPVSIPAKPAAKPERRRPSQPRRSRLRSKQATPYQAKRAAMEDLEVRRLRRDGFTPYFGKEQRFLMTPPEFDIVLACETRQVAQVIHEVLKQTVGYADAKGDGRREWVTLTFRHFEHRGLMGRDAAKSALDYAVKQGYLLRRRRGRQRWEYAAHYRTADNVPR